jgi:hypothetical protein
MRAFTRASGKLLRLAFMDLSTANGGEVGTKQTQGSLATPLVRIGEIIFKTVLSLFPIYSTHNEQKQHIKTCSRESNEPLFKCHSAIS